MKKYRVTAFALLAVLLLQTVAVYPLYHLFVFGARSEAQKQMLLIPQHELVHFTATKKHPLPKGATWMNDEEIEFGERMYDIVETKKTDDGQIFYICFDDTQEAAINTAFFKLSQQDENSFPASKPVKAFFSLFQLSYINSGSSGISAGLYSTTLEFTSEALFKHPRDGYAKYVAPPPRFV